MNEHVQSEDQWIDTAAGLESLANQLSGVSRLAIDTEANSFHAYHPRLCLLQVAYEVDGAVQVALIDGLALGQELGDFGRQLQSPDVEKILHGADNDVRMLHRDASIALKGLFDTQIAAKLLGEARTGLASLAALCLGLKISKSGQRLDWGRRPLSPAARRYAADDARILFEIRDQLAARLSDAGRMEWAREEFLLLEKVRFAPEKEMDGYELLARISGASRLDPHARAVLLELVTWRENEARRRGVPPVHIVPPQQLIELARRKNRSREGLRRAGISPRIIQRYGSSLLGALGKGLEAAPVHRNPAKRPAAAGPDAPPPGLLADLKSLRARAARELGLDEGTVCPTSVLKLIAREQPRSRHGLLELGMRKWQEGLLGDALRERLDEGRMRR